MIVWHAAKPCRFYREPAGCIKGDRCNLCVCPIELCVRLG